MTGSVSRAAVVIPLYKESMTNSEEFSFITTLTQLSKHDIYVISPYRLTHYMDRLKEATRLKFGVEYFPDGFFSSISGYNRLMMSADLYNRFKRYEYMLVVQTDALVLSDQLDHWCDRNYSYIGAPWFKGFDSPELPLTLLGVGNGGFSLRKVQDFIRVLSSHRYLPYLAVKTPIRLFDLYQCARFVKHRWIFAYSFPPLRPRVQEDIFWGGIIPSHFHFFSVPEPEAAVSFAFDVAPEHLFELNNRLLPFGCHAWERYNPQFWKSELNKIGMHPFA